MNAAIPEKTDFSKALAEPYNLPPEAIKDFKEKGYIKLKQVLSPDVINYYGPIISDWVVKLNTLTKPMSERTTYERAFLQIMNLWRENETIRDFVFSKRLAKIAADLMEVDGVRLYHDQALYKEPSGGITPWHADQFYWPLSTPKTVTVWVPLQATPMEMGPLAFAESSQTVEIGRDKEISDESEHMLTEALRQFPVQESPFDLGEVSYHSGWTFHRAGVNKSGQARRVMTVIYMDKDIKIVEPTNDYRVNDWKTWLDSRPIGSIADGRLNPILFEK
jgi:ectoine hydroxylase-related dioxygenase (phytanoyl-CoA dioxygenase family)